MPNGRCFSITFPEDTSVTFPVGSVVNIPGAPPFDLSSGLEVPFQAGTVPRTYAILEAAEALKVESPTPARISAMPAK